MNQSAEITVKGVTFSVGFSIKGHTYAATETDEAESPYIQLISVRVGEQELGDVLKESVMEAIEAELEGYLR